MFHTRTVSAAKGKWRGILLELGLPESCLRDKHGPCPVCGGEDRFRWDNKDGAGTFICNACGAGDGMKLAQAFTGMGFADAAKRIDALIGNLKADTPQQVRAELTDEQRRLALRAVYAATAPVRPGDLADKYLTHRGIGDTSYPKALRFGVLKDGEGGLRPCMVAMVCGPDGKPVTMHRTFLRPDGLAKAEMAAPRKLMPGPLPEGACVRLSDGHSAALGIAEGIETAMSASALNGLPVWAAINAAMMAKWQAPEGCDEVAIFADNDAKFGGHAAAYTLAHRLACKGLAVTVHVPKTVGTDWNDIHARKNA